MCYARREMSRKARIFLVIGCSCLAISPALGVYAHDLNANRMLWLDFVRGLLMGLAIAFNLAAARLSCRRPPQPLV
jgi:hypothetical protein